MGVSWRIWLLIILIILAVFTIINPQSFEGKVMIKEIELNSSASKAGISAGELLKEIDGQAIESVEDYTAAIMALEIQEIEFNIETQDNETFNYTGRILDFDLGNRTVISVLGKAEAAGLKEGMIVEKINGLNLEDYSFNEIKTKIEPTAKITILTNKQEYDFLAGEDIGIVPAAVARTRLRTGLDLQGGARALVKPERVLSEREMDDLLSVVRERLNTYGLTDVTIQPVRDLEGNRYMLIEMAGATPKELHDLVGKQGKFEAKIGNKTVFIGGRNDIPFVCRDDATCAFIESCDDIQSGAACRFKFQIQLSEQAAQTHANITAGLAENITETGKWLNETLDLYLDDVLVEQLHIDTDLKGKPATAIVIEGSGTGSNKQEAYKSAEAEMKRLQTVLITGSLPFKLEIAKLDSVSPALGKEFTRNVIIAALVVFIAVCIIIFIRYRKPILFIPVIITIISEALLVLFFMALFRQWWTLDLAAIAGIIAAIGTGVDDQIIMIDETKFSRQYSLKERIKRAFTIIFSAYATTAIALIPLWWAGTGLLRGFAISTLLGITVGVLVTRPAFAEILKKITRE